MLGESEFAGRIVGSLLIISGIVLLFSIQPQLLSPTLLIASVIAIQLLQGGWKPYLGSVGVFLVIVGVFVPTIVSNSSARMAVFRSVSSQILVSLLLFFPIALGVTLLGLSINQSEIFPRRSGTIMALSPLLGVIIGFNYALGIAFLGIGVVILRQFGNLKLGGPVEEEEMS